MEVSVFRNFWDKVPQGSTLEAMVEAIRQDGRTRELTAGYRRQKIDALKNESMLFAVPCIFEGGKAQKHVVRLTGMSMVDFDHIGSEELRVKSEEGLARRPEGESQFASATVYPRMQLWVRNELTTAVRTVMMN